MRIFVEKNINSKISVMENEIKNYLKINSLEKIRIIKGYEVLGLSDNQLMESKYSVFATENVDNVYFDINIDSENYFITRYLDHQYDQVSDIFETILKLKFQKQDLKVKSMEIFIFYGDLTKEDLDKIKSYYVNPLEVKLVTIDEPFNWNYCTGKVEKVEFIDDFSNFDENQLNQMKNTYSLSLSQENLKYIQEHYKKEGKIPSVTELKILDTYWSDHCRHSTFNTILEDVEISEEAGKAGLNESISRFDKAHKFVYKENRPLCLMDIATIQMKKLKKLGILDNMEQTDEVNACSIEVSAKVDEKDEDLLIMFKNETHNHPTEMEPFGGAGTCIGGGIRDPLSGRAKVFGAMRITGCSDPREEFEDTLKDKIPQRRLTNVAADGYSDYANQIGLASGYLDEYYHSGFKAKRLECGALVGFNYKENIIRQNPISGDVIVMVGGKTGRDGLGGATGSSKEVKDEAKNYSAQVQKGNPIIEKNILRLYENPEISRIIKKSNDFGAGGVSVAIGELAMGLEIDLDVVKLKYPSMDATEVAISESQERMAVLLDKDNLDKFIEEAKKADLDAVKVATVTDSKKMVMKYKGQIVCDIDTEFLNSGGIRNKARVKVEPIDMALLKEDESNEDISNRWKESLQRLNNCSKKPIANQFDKTVGGQNIFYPFGGKNMLTAEQGLAMKLPLGNKKCNLGVVMSAGYKVELSEKSPFHSAYYSVMESVLKAVTMGAKLKDIRLSFQEYFEKMSSKESFGKVYSALMGAYLAMDSLDLASIGGKDSMSGTYKDIDVPPTLISFALSPVNTKNLVSKAFKKSNTKVYLLKTPLKDDLLPDENKLKENIRIVEDLIENKKLNSAAYVNKNLALTISQMAFGNDIGIDLKTKEDLFKYRYLDIILETEEDLNLDLIGITNDEEKIRIHSEILDLAKLKKYYTKPLSKVFSEEYFKAEKIENSKSIIVEKKKINKPTALIPIFAAGNSVENLKAKLEKYGFEVRELLFKTKYPVESYRDLKEEIEKSDLIVFPQNISPVNNSAIVSKLITNVLSENSITQAINKFIDDKGIIIATGESFKSIIDLGLIENGRISKKTDSLNLVENPLNKHYNGIFETKIISKTSPFYSQGEDFEKTSVSMINGQIILDDEDFKKYYENGQIVSVFNEDCPFSKKYFIEAMTSPNGQVLGKLGDFSILSEDTLVNIGKMKDSYIFKNLKEHFVL